MWPPNEARSKRFVFDYISINSLMFNEVSLGDVMDYLLSALEVERPESEGHKNAMKCIFETIFAPAYQAYAFSSNMCMSEVMDYCLKPYILNEIEGVKTCNYMMRYRVRITATNSVVCYPCYRTHYSGKHACMVENGTKDCDQKSQTQRGAVEEYINTSRKELLYAHVCLYNSAPPFRIRPKQTSFSQVGYNREKAG